MTANLKNAFDTLQTSLLTNLNKKVGDVYTSDNASSVAGKSATDLSASNNARLLLHTNDKTNPHGVSAAQVGSLTKAETAAKYAATLSANELQFQYYGHAGTGIPITLNGTTLTIAAGVPVFLKDAPGIMGEFTTTFALNKLYYLYVRLVNGVYTYVVTPMANQDDYNQADESADSMCIGYYVTDGTGILRGFVLPRQRIGGVPITDQGYISDKFEVGAVGLSDGTYRPKIGLRRNNRNMSIPIRGVRLVAFLNGEVYRTASFDLYGDGSTTTKLLNFVNSIPSGVSVLIYSWDSYNNPIVSELQTALTKLGIDPTIFFQKMKFRTAVLAFGKKDAAVGSVPVGYCGLVDNDANASIVANFRHNDSLGFHDITVIKAGNTMINF